VFAVLVAIFLSLLWGASELHYQGCVNAAAARATSPSDRAEAVAGCSHLP
jgi:hypothetical protein